MLFKLQPQSNIQQLHGFFLSNTEVGDKENVRCSGQVWAKWEDIWVSVMGSIEKVSDHIVWILYSSQLMDNKKFEAGLCLQNSISPGVYEY